jgi:integrase/recombinase XerD
MITRDSYKSTIAPDLISYISLKQALGRRFESGSIILLYLDRFLCTLKRPSPDLTADTFWKWYHTMTSISNNTKLNRLRTVQQFCLYRRRKDPACFVPDSAQFPIAGKPIRPYIFSNIEIARLLYHSRSISVSSRSPLRAATIRMAIVLLYTTGLRRGELLRLTRSDYNRAEQTLTIHSSKFYKSRLLPIPNDVAIEVEKFIEIHKSACPQLPVDSPLFLNPVYGEKAYCGGQLRKNMHLLFNLAGIRKPDGSFPRIHDFRASFAINALLRWYHEGFNIQAKLPFLAAYMGHISVLSTYYYLQWIEPLASAAGSLFATHYGDLIQQV